MIDSSSTVPVPDGGGAETSSDSATAELLEGPTPTPCVWISGTLPFSVAVALADGLLTRDGSDAKPAAPNALNLENDEVPGLGGRLVELEVDDLDTGTPDDRACPSEAVASKVVGRLNSAGPASGVLVGFVPASGVEPDRFVDTAPLLDTIFRSLTSNPLSLAPFTSSTANLLMRSPVVDP